MSVTRGLRYYVFPDERYVARDRLLPDGRLQPEHAIWEPPFVVNDFKIAGHVTWWPHSEGGMMERFDGPDDVFDEITRGGDCEFDAKAAA